MNNWENPLIFLIEWGEEEPFWNTLAYFVLFRNTCPWEKLFLLEPHPLGSYHSLTDLGREVTNLKPFQLPTPTNEKELRTACEVHHPGTRLTKRMKPNCRTTTCFSSHHTPGLHYKGATSCSSFMQAIMSTFFFFCLFLLLFSFFFFFCGLWRFSGQGLNLRHSWDLYHNYGNTGSLAYCPREKMESCLSNNLSHYSQVLNPL